ncbi:MAG: VWA domain-containing protein [Terriglobales bacterium]
MDTNRSFGTLRRTAYLNKRLALLLALVSAFGMAGAAGYAQNCAQCMAEVLPPDPVPTGEWLLTKQVNEVNVLFVAARDGKAVGGLSQNDISVSDDNKRPAAILGFRTDQQLPLRVGMLIDTSSSVTSRFRFEQAAANVFLHQTLNRSSDLGLVLGFSNYATVMQEFVADPDLLSKAVDQLTIGGGTALYDAIRTGCQKLRQPEKDMVARVIVVLSDGQNNAGVGSLEGAIAAAQEGEVTIYAVSTNYSRAQADPGAEQGNSALRKLAEQTGGRVLFPADPKAVGKAFAKIGEELRSRYAVSYKPADFRPDGHYRKIRIEARQMGKKLEVRARKGYRAELASSLSADSSIADGSLIVPSR